MKTTTNTNQMTTAKVTSNELNISSNMIEYKELILGYDSVIPKDASLDYDLDMWQIMYNDISYSSNEVSDFFTKLNIFWDTYGVHHPYLNYVYRTMLSRYVVMSFMCRLDTQDDVKSFDKVFDGNLNNHTILQHHKDQFRRENIVSIIDPDSKKVKIFEIDYEKCTVSKPTKLLDILLNYTLNTYQFNYEKENYFEKNTNNGITYSFLLTEMILVNDDIEWSW